MNTTRPPHYGDAPTGSGCAYSTARWSCCDTCGVRVQSIKCSNAHQTPSWRCPNAYFYKVESALWLSLTHALLAICPNASCHNVDVHSSQETVESPAPPYMHRAAVVLIQPTTNSMCCRTDARSWSWNPSLADRQLRRQADKQTSETLGQLTACQRVHGGRRRPARTNTTLLP